MSYSFTKSFATMKELTFPDMWASRKTLSTWQDYLLLRVSVRQWHSKPSGMMALDTSRCISIALSLSSILTKGIKKTMPTSTYGENWFILGAVVSCWRGKEASLSVCKVSRKAAQRLYRRYEEVSWVRVSNKRLRDKHLHNKWTNLSQTIFPCCAFCVWYFRTSPSYIQ